MLFMDYSTLTAFCSTNSIIHSICQDDYFWKLKIEHDFGMLTQYKPEAISYRQQYKDLMNTKDPNQAAMDDRIDLLMNLGIKNLYPDQYGANYSALYGQLEVLKWLAFTRNLYPNQDGVNYAAKYGHLEVVSFHT